MAEGGEKRSKTSHRTPKQIVRQTKGTAALPKNRAKRGENNKARALKLDELTKKHGAAKAKKMMANKDVGHKKPLSKGGTNRMANLELQSKKKNRGHGMTKGKKANMNKGKSRKA